MLTTLGSPARNFRGFQRKKRKDVLPIARGEIPKEGKANHGTLFEDLNGDQTPN